MTEREFVPLAEAFTQIAGKEYDLIHVDFGREHPAYDIVHMRLFSPNELIARTDVQAAQLLANYVDQHLTACDAGCNRIREDEFVSRGVHDYEARDCDGRIINRLGVKPLG